MRVYNSQITRLPEEHPNIYKYFTGGAFSVQISKETLLVEYLLTKLLTKPQTRIPQTTGGTKGLSKKPSAVSKYYLNAEYRTTAIKQLLLKSTLHIIFIQIFSHHVLKKMKLTCSPL